MVDVIVLKPGDSMPSQTEGYVQVVRNLATDGSQRVSVQMSIQEAEGVPDIGFEQDEVRHDLTRDEMISWAVETAESSRLSTVVALDNTI